MSANDSQVGGTHYHAHGDKLQHWDLAVMYQWDPFQYQVTKYLMRWKFKHSTPEKRLEDLRKAAHFLQKYIEVAAEYDQQDVPTVVHAPSEASEHFLCEGYYGDLTQEYKCVHCGASVRAPSAQYAYDEHGACAPAAGYVNQD